MTSPAAGEQTLLSRIVIVGLVVAVIVAFATLFLVRSGIREADAAALQAELVAFGWDASVGQQPLGRPYGLWVTLSGVEPSRALCSEITTEMRRDYPVFITSDGVDRRC